MRLYPYLRRPRVANSLLGSRDKHTQARRGPRAAGPPPTTRGNACAHKTPASAAQRDSKGRHADRTRRTVRAEAAQSSTSRLERTDNRVSTTGVGIAGCRSCRSWSSSAHPDSAMQACAGRTDRLTSTPPQVPMVRARLRKPLSVPAACVAVL
eukprot:5218914-Prymnesium_polylepis.1